MLLTALRAGHLHCEAAEVAEVPERARAHRAAEIAWRDGCEGPRGGACMVETRPSLSRDGTPADDQVALRRLDAVDAIWTGQSARSSTTCMLEWRC